MWDLIWFCVAGAAAGALAKAILPGDKHEPKGCLMTMALGIGGSLLVAMVMRLFGYTGTGSFIPTIIGATIGAIAIVLLMRRFWSSGGAAK